MFQFTASYKKSTNKLLLIDHVALKVSSAILIGFQTSVFIWPINLFIVFLYRHVRTRHPHDTRHEHLFFEEVSVQSMCHFVQLEFLQYLDF